MKAARAGPRANEWEALRKEWIAAWGDFGAGMAEIVISRAKEAALAAKESQPQPDKEHVRRAAALENHQASGGRGRIAH